MNDLNQLDMQVSFQDIELKVRFSSHSQMLNWKESIAQVQQGRAIAQTKPAHSRTNSEDIAPDQIDEEHDISFE